MSDLDHYHRHRANQAGLRAACPGSRLADRPAGADTGPFADRVNELIIHGDFAPGAEVLDYGCGAGLETDRLAKAVGGRALGVDASLPLIREATPTERARFSHAPNGMVPTGRNRFDLVYVSLVLGGLCGRNLDRAVTELTRVLKPGGLLILIDATGEASRGVRWTDRPDHAYRALFPTVDLQARDRFDRGGDHLTLLAGRAMALATPTR